MLTGDWEPDGPRPHRRSSRAGEYPRISARDAPLGDSTDEVLGKCTGPVAGVRPAPVVLWSSLTPTERPGAYTWTVTSSQLFPVRWRPAHAAGRCGRWAPSALPAF